jgi:Beta-galactosidase/beta-glucuronidase
MNLFVLRAAALGLCAFTPGVAFCDWKPVAGKMLTPWGEKLDPSQVWTSYPRPLLERPKSTWMNLNGLWKYKVTARNAPRPTDWSGEILVPFCLEAPLSGVGRELEPREALWYSRTLPEAQLEKRMLLHFEAVDYETTVWVNGVEVGTHVGGNTPFSFDITDALKPGANELVVRVFDATEEYQLNGKQRLKPEGIWYTRVSGIWQTVWLEAVPPRSFEEIDYATDIAKGTIEVKPKLRGEPLDGEQVKVTAYFRNQPVASATGTDTVTLKIPGAKLWSPDEPNIYDLMVELQDGGGQTVDVAKSYTALREVGKMRDANGNWRFTLNGRPIFHWGPLDQGWWPDGLLTPPSEEAMVSDMKFLKEAGFNMIRKHIKIEPRIYYTYCDRMGFLVWQDQVSTGHGPRWTRFDQNPQDASWPPEAKEQWTLEYKRMVDHLGDHPSIVVWTVFNEAWGQHDTLEMGEMAVNYDRTRHINIASGGNFWEIGDIADHHSYPDPGFPLNQTRLNDYIKVVGEFGGHGWPVRGHLWSRQARNWGYGGLPRTLREWKERYEKSMDVLCRLRTQGIAAGVYTQTTDVEGEINGLLTYDRLPKVETSWLKALADKLYKTPDVPGSTASK